VEAVKMAAIQRSAGSQYLPNSRRVTARMKQRAWTHCKFVLSRTRRTRYRSRMATVVALLIAGALLILLETILPGLVAGILGFVCVCIGVALSYNRFDLQTANTVLVAVMIVGVIGTIFYVKYFPESRVARLFVSKRAIGEIGAENPSLLHQTGQALTKLRPSGTAVINGKRVDVVSEGAFIEAGQPIKVVALEGLRVVVRAV
jgi:membrane-bound serine protease (ClpP class)